MVKCEACRYYKGLFYVNKEGPYGLGEVGWGVGQGLRHPKNGNFLKWYVSGSPSVFCNIMSFIRPYAQ